MERDGEIISCLFFLLEHSLLNELQFVDNYALKLRWVIEPIW